MMGKIWKKKFERARRKSPILKYNLTRKKASKSWDFIPQLYLEFSNIKPTKRVCMNIIKEENSHDAE